MLETSVATRSKRLAGLLIVTGLVALAILVAATAALAAFHLERADGSRPAGIVSLPRDVAMAYGAFAQPDYPLPTPKPIAVTRRASPTRLPDAGTSVWDRLAQCESGGNWGYNGGSGFDGGLQFLPSTWRAAGGTKYAPYAYQATREQQIAIAQAWLNRTSWSQWPACSRKLGLR